MKPLNYSFLENKMKLVLNIFLALIFLNPLQSQQQKDFLKLKTRYGFDVLRRPYVNFNIIPHYSGDSWIPNLYLAFEIQNDRLQFTKEGEDYIAKYQISVAIRQDKKTIYKENWTETESLDNFKDTNAEGIYQYKVHKLNLATDLRTEQLKPGIYECVFQVRDFTSENRYKSIRKFKIEQFNQSNIKTSSINFLYGINHSVYNQPFVPSPEALHYNIPYRSYANVFLDSIKGMRINARIYKNEKDDGQLFHQEYLTLNRDSCIVDLVYDLPSDSMEPGKYRIQFSGYSDDKELIIEKEFEIFWFDKSTYLYKPDLAIRPMRYLLSEDEFDQVDDMDYKEQEKWMELYWQQQDPSPNTQYNELKVEYFKRVQIANKKFALRHKEGWETDRGKILLLYGEPDKIENKSHAANQKPHIVWIYNNYDLTFLFVDADRNGEFTLMMNENRDEE